MTVRVVPIGPLTVVFTAACPGTFDWPASADAVNSAAATRTNGIGMNFDFMSGGSPLRQAPNGTRAALNGTRLSRSEPGTS